MTRTRLASPTLVRLYLSQGHLDEALAVAQVVRAEGTGLGTVEGELAAAVDERTARLEHLLDVVRRRRAAHRDGRTEGTDTATGRTAQAGSAHAGPASPGRGR